MTCSPWDLPMQNGSRHSNLQCFLHCITPTLHTNKKCFHVSDGFMQQPLEKDTVGDTLTLCEFWHSYTEWSAYGAGVPIMLDNGKSVMQYYSPFLSALQLFTTKPYPWSKSPSDQIDEMLENKIKPENNSGSNYGNSSKTWSNQINEELNNKANPESNTCKKDGTPSKFQSDQIDEEVEIKEKLEINSFSNVDTSSNSQSDEIDVELENRAKSENNGCCNDTGGHEVEVASGNGSLSNLDATWNDSTSFQYVSCQVMEKSGFLYCQFNEVLSPYERIPLSEKIKELARTYPGLLDLHCIDVSPYSWVAIAWYPLYQIPSVKNVKELSACFLTYHPLSLLSQGSEKEGEISLPPFALVPYKMSGKLWINPETSDEDSIICQQTAACCWLDQVHFQHHDFNFFMSHK